MALARRHALARGRILDLDHLIVRRRREPRHIVRPGHQVDRAAIALERL